MNAPHPDSPSRMRHQLHYEVAAPVSRAHVDTQWSEAIQSAYFSMDVRVGAGFRTGTLERLELAEMRSCSLYCDAMTTERQAAHVNAETEDFYVIDIPRINPILTSQRGRDALSRPGDFVLLSVAETYRYENAAPVHLLSLHIPCRTLRARLPSIDDYVALNISGAQPCTRLFLDFTDSYFENAQALTPDQHTRIAQQLLDLLVLSVAGTPATASETSVRSAHKLRAMRVIEQRFADPGLQPSTIADAIGVSDRYLQKIFADGDTTIGQAIRARRISEARRLLANRRQSQLTVTQIALLVGFSDSAHFSRVFRQECGVAPSEYC